MTQETGKSMATSRQTSKAGFTLTEVMVASSIATLVAAGVLTTFIWCISQASTCAKIAWSQNVAMNTSAKLTMYLRNAAQILAIDESEGKWVQLRFTDGTTARLVYSNSVPLLRDGRLSIQATNGTQTIVARGLTEIQRPEELLFQKTGANSLRVGYRVSEPESNPNPADDARYGCYSLFRVCLRNAEP